MYIIHFDRLIHRFPNLCAIAGAWCRCSSDPGDPGDPGHRGTSRPGAADTASATRGGPHPAERRGFFVGDLW